MKKTLFILSIILITVSYSQAQLKYGPRVGLNVANIQGVNTGAGGHVGAFFNAELLDRAGIQAEFVYHLNTGSKDDEQIDGTVVTNSLVLNYIEVPLLFYFGISEHLTLMVGPHLMNSVSGTETISSTAPGSEDVEIDVEPDLGVGLSVGIDVYMYSPLRVGVRYSLNPAGDQSTDVTDPTAVGPITDGAVSTIMLTASYTFDW